MLQAVLRPLDNVFLYVPVKLREIGTVPRNTHKEVRIFRRMLLSVPQRAGVNHVELHVPASEVEQATDKR